MRRDGLIRRRKASGLTQEQLADLLECDAQAVSRWERGVADPRVDMRRRLARALGLSLAELDPLVSSPADTRAGGAAREHLPVTGVTHAGRSERELDAVLHHLHTQWCVLVQAANLMGPAHTLGHVLDHLAWIESLLDETRGRDWQRLARLGGRFGESAAWLYEDLCDMSSSRMWLTRARQWARASGDTNMLTWTDYRRSQHALAHGQPARALGLARLAAENTRSEPMTAAVAVMQGLAHAHLGDETQCHRMLDIAGCHAATDAVGDAHQGHGAFATPTYVELHRAWCHTLLGRPTLALDKFTHLETLPVIYRRDRARDLARLAHTYLQANHPHDAASTAHDALMLATDVGSRRTIHHVATITQELDPRHPRAADLLDQLQDIT